MFEALFKLNNLSFVMLDLNLAIYSNGYKIERVLI